MLTAGFARADFQAGFDAYNAGDFATALKEWQASADKGDAKSEWGLGLIYDIGRSVPADPAEAAKWYALSAAQGFPAAENNLALLCQAEAATVTNNCAAALVLVFVGFILLQKDDLRDRFVRLAGSRDMQRTTVALDEAATRLSRYLFLQTCINTCFGLMIGGGLWLIGIPNAGLWALMSMLLRFVPYLGVPLAFIEWAAISQCCGKIRIGLPANAADQ